MSDFIAFQETTTCKGSDSKGLCLSQTNGEVLSKAEERKRPEGGWDFMVEELGKDGKRGKGGGRRFVAKADGARRPLNELEKLMMKREMPRRRKFDFL
jgi:hypothetical protein